MSDLDGGIPETAYSGVIRTPIPIDSGHLFRSYPDTHSGRSDTHSGHSDTDSGHPDTCDVA